MSFSGIILGYDPGGNGNHGVAACRFETGIPLEIEISTCESVEDVLSFAEAVENLKAIGIDTLTCWGAGQSGWRPADLILRQHYKSIIHSVTSPNSLAGSMGLNGMSVLIGLRHRDSALVISETHPKVLYFALTGTKYDYVNRHAEMDRLLSSWLNIEVKTKNDHEWDAVVSILAALKGLNGDWHTDLHAISAVGDGRLIRPCGDSNYWWPELL